MSLRVVRVLRKTGAVLLTTLMVSLLLLVMRGQPTIHRLEKLLKQKPTTDEVTQFLRQHDVPHTVDRNRGTIAAGIDTCPIPFDSAKVYLIQIGGDDRVTGYTSHNESVAP